MSKLPPPTMIANYGRLQQLAQDLARQPLLGIDTESNSLYAYREQVCLIQISCQDKDYLVDPLAINDLSPLGPIFADPNIEKIFHAAEYDILTLKRDFGFQFTNLFDTMVAARILGKPRFGLGTLLEDEFNVKLAKKFQRANWGKRPLPPPMLSYARLDTHYLIRLRNKLRDELQQGERWPLAQEDFERLCNLNGNGPEPTEFDIWRIKSARDLSPEDATILKYLAGYRDQYAKKRNIPLFKVISDKTLAEIAEARPETRRELADIEGMTDRQIQRHGREILAAVRDGLLDGPTYPPKIPRLPDDVYNRLEALRDWRKHTARKLDVESDIVLPRDLMETIAETNPPNRPALDNLLADVPWRRERFGQQIFDLL